MATKTVAQTRESKSGLEEKNQNNNFQFLGIKKYWAAPQEDIWGNTFDGSIQKIQEMALIENYTGTWDHPISLEVYDLVKKEKFYYGGLSSLPIVGHIHEVNGKLIVKNSSYEFIDLKTGYNIYQFDWPISPEIHTIGRNHFVFGEEGRFRDRIFYLTTGNIFREFPQILYDTIISFENKSLVFGKDDQTIYNLRTGKEYWKTPQEIRVLFGNGQLGLGEDNQTIYNIKTKEEYWKAPERIRQVGEWLAVGKDGKTIYNTQSKKEHWKTSQSIILTENDSFYKNKSTRIRYCGIYEFNVNNKNLVIGKDHKTLFDLQNKKIFCQLPKEMERMRITEVNGRGLVQKLDDKRIFLDIQTGEEFCRFPEDMESTINNVYGKYLCLTKDNKTFYELEFGNK